MALTILAKLNLGVCPFLISIDLLHFPKMMQLQKLILAMTQGARREGKRDLLLKGTLDDCQDWGVGVVRVDVGAWWWGLGCGQPRVATGGRLLVKQAKARVSSGLAVHLHVCRKGKRSDGNGGS